MIFVAKREIEQVFYAGFSVVGAWFLTVDHEGSLDLMARAGLIATVSAAIPRKPAAPASWKAMSEESTGWYLPNTSDARTSTTGYPAMTPFSMASTTLHWKPSPRLSM